MILNISTNCGSLEDEQGYFSGELNLSTSTCLSSTVTAESRTKTSTSFIPLPTTPENEYSYEQCLSNVRSKKEIEHDFLRNIEKLVRQFVNEPHRQYPCYRVMRWTTDQQPKIEDFVTVVINQSTSIL